MNFLKSELVFYVANAAMILRAVGKCSVIDILKRPVHIPHFPYPHGAMSFMTALAIWIRIAVSLQGVGAGQFQRQCKIITFFSSPFPASAACFRYESEYTQPPYELASQGGGNSYAVYCTDTPACRAIWANGANYRDSLAQRETARDR